MVNINNDHNEILPCSSTQVSNNDKGIDHGSMVTDDNLQDQVHSFAQNQSKDHQQVAITPIPTAQQSQVNNGAPLSLNQIDDTINAHLSDLINQDESYPKPGNYTPTDLPVDLKVSDKSKNLIWSNQYIDLAVLLDPSLEIHKPKNELLSQLGEELNLAPKKNARYITSLGQWCSAFTVYITVYCQKFPAQLPHLFTYMNTVKKLSHRNGAYLTYDEEFRYLRQSQPLQWNVTHPGLWMECRDNPNSSKGQKNGRDKKHNSNRFQNSDYNVKKQSHPTGYCFRYHTYGKCGRNGCGYKHFCYNQLCNNDEHPISRCPNSGKSHDSNQYRSNKPVANAPQKSK